MNNNNDQAKKLYQLFTAQEYSERPYQTEDIGEGMALISQTIYQYWKPRIILDHKTRCAYEFMSERERLVTVEGSDINWESLEGLPNKAIDCAKYLDFHYPSFVGHFRNGIAQVQWRINPDGRYFMDDDGFGMTSDDEISIYGFINKKAEVVLKFQTIKSYEELQQLRLKAEENLLTRQKIDCDDASSMTNNITINVIKGAILTHSKELKNGSIHVIAYAEAGMSFFRSYLEFDARMDMNKANSICDLINIKNETSTMYPVLNLTGIPLQFARVKIDANDSHRINLYKKCIKDCFLANQQYIKSNHMVFEFRCCAENTDILEYIVKEVVSENYCTEYIQLIELFID